MSGAILIPNVNFISLKLDVGLGDVINVYNSQTKTLNVSADSYYQNENVYNVR
jgi:hypothetical protein